jgi:hypothetical protein
MRSIFILSISFLYQITFAQLTSDALLFSENHSTVNARSMALGNSLGALGGDLSTANLNPAGMAVYRRMELSFSLGSFFDNTTTDFLGNKNKDRMSQFSFGSAGLVVASKLRNNSSGWKFVNFGITVNRLSNYGRTFSWSGLSSGSRIQSFAENASGYSIGELDPYEGWVAYYAFLIDSVGPVTYAPNGGISDSTYTFKSETLRRTGGVNELGLTVAGNYNHKLYIGATLGIDFLAFNEDKIYSESADSMDFQTFDFAENRNVKGTGINFKLGIIYRVNKSLRFGLAVHTPTAYRLVDSYNSGLYGRIVYDSVPRVNDYPMEGQDPFVLQHDLVTPWVFMGSLGIVIAKRAFIGIDVEYADYSWSSFSLLDNDKTTSNNQFISDLNKRVQGEYQGTLKARIGGEVAIGIARIRLGYQFQSSPYQKSVTGITDFRHDISVGAGIRWKHFFIDFSYVHTISDFAHIPYSSTTLVQQVTGQSQTGHAMLTFAASVFK